MSLDAQIKRHDACMQRMIAAYRTWMTRACREADLTPPQFWALHTIHKMGQSKMSPLADALGLSMGASSTLIDRLVSRGYVERHTDAADRRAVHVSLTEAGQAVLGTVSEQRTGMSRRVFQAIPEPLRESFVSGLEAITAEWEQIVGDDPEPGVGFCQLGE